MLNFNKRNLDSMYIYTKTKFKNYNNTYYEQDKSIND